MESMLLGAQVPDLLSRDELLRILGVQARNGSITAARLLLEEYRRETEKPEIDGIDQLAARRAARISFVEPEDRRSRNG
jgi:hypothetical protein